MSYLRYVRINKNEREIYTGWFDYDLYAVRDSNGNIKEFTGNFAKYIKGFCTIDTTFLNSFNSEYNYNNSLVVFRGIVDGGKIKNVNESNVDEKNNYNTIYEIWYNDNIVFSGSLKLNIHSENKYIESVDEESIVDIIETRNEPINTKAIQINMKKQLFASIINENNYYSDNINLLQDGDDFFNYDIEELMKNGTFSPKEDFVKKGEIYKRNLSFESGSFSLSKDSIDYFVYYTIEKDTITLKYKSTTYIFNGSCTNKVKPYYESENEEGSISYYEFSGKLKTYIGDELKSSSKIKIIPKVSTIPNSSSKIRNITRLIQKNSTGEEIIREQYDEVSLDDLIGLTKVKETFYLLENFAKYRSILKSKSENENDENQSMNMVFKGNPGTGKTTVAKRVANLLYQYGILKTNTCVIAHRHDLVAEYIGQTEAKVEKVIEQAMGGVLFIDEAYMLDETSENDYGRIALIQIMNAMDTHKGNIVIIFAGYMEKMKKLLELNEGLASRIKWFLDFEDYSKEELGKILLNFIEKYSYEIDNETFLFAEESLALLQSKLDNPKESKFKFGNGRGVSEFYEFMEISLANRMIKSDYNNMSIEELKTFNSEDVVYAKEVFLRKISEEKYTLPIGFKK